MPYIPKEHEKYDLLPWCREHGGEVFEYPALLDRVSAKVVERKEESLMPYGYMSYEEYFAMLSALQEKYNHDEELSTLLTQLIEQMIVLNRKEEWSVLQYVGPSDDSVLGLTHRNTYYWPTTKENPKYQGVIDDEEFTSYWHPTEPDMWKILEDPTGMAHRILYEKAKGYTSKETHDRIMTQIKRMMENGDE